MCYIKKNIKALKEGKESGDEKIYKQLTETGKRLETSQMVYRGMTNCAI